MSIWADSADCTDSTDCAAELDHCHGTLVTHHDGFAECTEDACVAFDPARHTLSIGCQDIDGGCGCGHTVDLTLAAEPAFELLAS
jgi:hypothetical protein